MSGLRLLDLVKPFLPILPEVELPLQKVPYDEKLVWTVTIGAVYFILSEISLYGVTAVDTYDPLYFLRTVLASTKGSLLEIGISPILTSGFIFQILGGLQYMDVHFDYKIDRQLYQSAQKLLAIVLTVLQAFAILFSGLYGSPSEMGVSKCFLFVAQLVAPGLFVIYADEVMQKGYSWGSAASFFSLLKCSQEIVWRALSLETNDFGRGKEFTGALPALVQYLWTRNYKNALIDAFFRNNLPNLIEVYVTVAAFFGLIYLMFMRVDLAIKSTKVRAPASRYPIPLLYTGGLPLQFVAAITSNVFLFSQALYRNFPENLLVRLFGTWAVQTGSNRLTAVSGLAYYLTPPFSIAQAVWDPIKTVFYFVFLISTCALFARTWAELSGNSPRDVAKLFKQQNIVLVGQRDTAIVKELKRYIPVAAAAGGAVVAAISFGADLIGAAGMGTAAIVGGTTLKDYFETFAQEGGAPGDMQGLF